MHIPAADRKMHPEGGSREKLLLYRERIIDCIVLSNLKFRYHALDDELSRINNSTRREGEQHFSGGNECEELGKKRNNFLRNNNFKKRDLFSLFF